MVTCARTAWVVGALAAAGIALGMFAPGEVAAEPRAPLVVDRVMVRWHTPELGGAKAPQFVLERQLAFAARIEALATGAGPEDSPDDRHARAALDRLLAETLLSQLPVRPEPTPVEVAQRAEAARLLLEDRVGGRERLADAARAEGIVVDEVDAVLRRTARASLYLDRMVAPMLDPSEAELREAHATGKTPLADVAYAEAADRLRRWWIAQRLEEALDTFYQRARSRITLAVSDAAPGRAAKPKRARGR